MSKVKRNNYCKQEKIEDNPVVINNKEKTKVIVYSDTDRGIKKNEINSENDEQKSEPSEPQKSEPKKCRLKKICLIPLIVLIAILIIGLIVFFIISSKDKKKIDSDKNESITNEEIKDNGEDSKDNEENKDDTKVIEERPIIISKDEAMKVFEPIFKIASKEDTLTQLLLKSTQEYNTVSNGIESSYSTFTKTKYDIYTLNQTSSGEDKDFYSTKYTTVVTINSFCTKFSSDSSENDCELKKYLDLNIKNTNNLRRNDEDNLEQIKKVILPLCIIEHTDTNIIISVTCPETLASNLKNDIILAFQSIKPDSANSLNDDENIAGTTTEEKDNKIYIKSFDNVCRDYDGNPDVNMTCELIRDIVTDKEGNLITSKKISTSQTIKDDKNKFSSNFIYNFEDISNQTIENFDPKTYKSNLNFIFDLTKNLMIKENYILNGSFNEILDFLVHGDDDGEPESNLRNLKEEYEENLGVNEVTVFYKSIYNIDMTLNMINDIGLEVGELSKAISNYNIGNKSQELSNNQKNTTLKETLNKFISLSKAGNRLASIFYEQLNGPLLDLRDKIIINIEDLNNLLAFKDLSAIFDSTLAINDLEKLSWEFITAAENLYKNLNELNINLPYVIENTRKKLELDVSDFLSESHVLLFNIFENLTQSTNSLSSKKSKIAEISTYYLNDTDTSYVEVIKQAKEIVDTYYIKEKELIEPLVDDMLNSFPETTFIAPLKNIQSSLDKIRSKLNNGELIINLASNDDYKNTISNLYNSEIKVDEIISKVKQQFKNAIHIKSNGYFETQKEIDINKKSYGEISERAMNISYKLDNNELIDKTFDDLMIYFREQSIVLLNYMDKSKTVKFPLKEDSLSTSIFTQVCINQIDDKFNNQKIKILNFIENENNEYLNLINEKINSVKSEIENTLEQTLNNIQNQLSALILDNINTKYNESLSTTINSINTIIENNRKLAVQYLTQVKNVGSTHITQKYINIYNTYITSLNKIKSYIQNNLKSHLASKYKNIINQIRSNLQSIKSNSIIKKYINQFEFAERHIRIIEKLYERFDKHISDSLFNNNYLPLINNFVNTTYNNLNQIENELKNFYNSQSRLAYSSSSSYDYFKYQIYAYICCGFKLGRCWSHTTCYLAYFAGYNVANTNNHLKLQSINMDTYTNNFDLLYNNTYSNIKDNVNSYNNILEEQLNQPLELIKQNILNKNENNTYLNGLTENVNSIKNEKLGINLLNASYNYYKNEITQKLPIELNDILEQWNNFYDKLYEDLNSNINNFKSSMKEFYFFSIIYYTMYSQNISTNYSNSITTQLKNDFNYTIKYYYNTILSKVNKTFSYILNNMPTNEKPFDEILIIRTNEIKQSYNNLINQIQASKNEILQLQKQLNTFKVNENNFFLCNSYIVENIDNIKQQIGIKIALITKLSNDNLKDTSEELIVARFYLENAQNGKQIKENYEPVNKATFIDLQNDVYQNLINKIWEIDQKELINNIKSVLINSNEQLSNNFKYEKEKYINILQEKIYNEYYTKEDLDKKINEIYTNGIKNLDENSKNVIYGYLNEVLNKIKSHITNEVSRLSNELTSYSNNYNLIINRLNNYKNTIYNQFYSTILSVVNNFYSQVKKIFYEDYIVKYLDVYQNYAVSYEEFKQCNFLNISFNLKEIVSENIIIIIEEYKNLTKNQIDFLNKKKIQELDELFSFNNLQNTINNEIDSIYESQLLPILKKEAIYNSSEEGVLDYDLSSNIIDDIDKLINQKISQTKEVIEKMKGNNYLEENFQIPPDFSSVKINEFKNIKTLFNSFTETYHNQEKNELRNLILGNIKNNFKIIIDNFVPSFGKDYFDRILNYNEIQKIQGLYNNLKYSLLETNSYYILLCKNYIKTLSSSQLPEDIKLKLLNLNNIDAVIKSKNDLIISTLNSKMDEFFKDTKNYIVEKYINGMKNESNIKLNFKDNIIAIIEEILDGNRYIFENEYMNMMNNLIKNPFIEQYKITLNKETNEMNYFIKQLMEQLKPQLNKIFTLNTDNELKDIENKLNKTVRAVEAYNSHFKSFKISDQVKIYLEDFGKDIIYSKYQYIKILLDSQSKDIIFENLQKNYEEFKKEYQIDIFENKYNEMNNNFTKYFNEMNQTINNYGYIESYYKENLNKEILNYHNIRRLDELDNEKIIYKQQAADLKLDETFQELKNSSLFLKEFIQSFSGFSKFDEKINKYINDIKYQNTISENTIKKNTENYDELSSKLYELNSLSLRYYNKANLTYYKLKESIIDFIVEINELIEKCANITYKSIADYYISIKDEFNPVNEVNKNEEILPSIEYTEEKEEYNYIIETTFEKYLKDNQFILDILFEDEDIKKPKIVGKVINRNKPKSMKIDFYSMSGQTGKIGRKINVEFNNISSSIEIKFDGGLNNAIINFNLSYDKYNIYTKFYESVDYTEDVDVGGLYLPGVIFDDENDVETPETEETLELVESKTENKIVSYSF